MNEYRLLLPNNLPKETEMAYVTVVQSMFDIQIRILYFDETGNIYLDDIEDEDTVILLALFEEKYPAIQSIFEDISEKHITLTIDFH